MANVKEMMIHKESLKYRDVCEYEGKFYDWKAGEHLLQKGMVVDEIFHPLEHDIVFEKDLQVTLRDGVKILTDVYLPADTDEPLPAIIAWSWPRRSSRKLAARARSCSAPCPATTPRCAVPTLPRPRVNWAGNPR